LNALHEKGHPVNGVHCRDVKVLSFATSPIEVMCLLGQFKEAEALAFRG